MGLVIMRKKSCTIMILLILIISVKVSIASSQAVYDKDRGEVHVSIYPDKGSRVNPVRTIFKGKQYGEGGASLIKKINIM